jgi:hypothetical protein
VWCEPVQGRKEQNEERLRQYLLTRLTDLASARFGAVVQLMVDAVEGHGDKPDLVAAIGNERVVIEIKWSHDRRCGQDLSKLARHYLVDQHRSHGLYVVGFTGRGSKPNEAALADKLSARAVELEQEHVGTRIAVVVLPFMRPPPARKRRARPARGNGGS